MYFFDSNILIDFLRGRLPLALQMLENTDHRLVKIPAVVQAELLLGARKSRNPGKTRRAVEQLLCNYEIVPFDAPCAYAYARIRAELEAEGMAIGPNDLLIAATAVAHDAVLVTNNVREFKRVPNLSLVSLSEIELPAAEG